MVAELMLCCNKYGIMGDVAMWSGTGMFT